MTGARVTITQATRVDASVLENLLELYLHDMSEAFPIELGTWRSSS